MPSASPPPQIHAWKKAYLAYEMTHSGNTEGNSAAALAVLAALVALAALLAVVRAAAASAVSTL